MTDIKFVVDADIDEKEICARFEDAANVIVDFNNYGDCYFTDIEQARAEAHAMLDAYFDALKAEIK